MVMNSVFKVRNVQICCMPNFKGVYFLIDINGVCRLLNVDMSNVSCKRVGLLMLRNRVFMMRNFEIWAFLSSNEVDLLMLRNRVFRLRNVQKRAVPSRKGGRFADAQESRLQGAARSQMVSAVLQGGWFSDAQESRIQAAKVSEMGSFAQQWGWFPDDQESRIHVAKHS